jgi:hypothetical protein
MLLQELLQKLSKVDEARRNPEQNEKIAGHPAAVKFLKGKDLKSYGVSMTKIPKLGINPGSNYNTPVGIYYYPAEFYMSHKDSSTPTKLPFVDDAEYIQVFELQGNVIQIDELNSSQFNSYISKLYANINKVAQLLGLSEKNTEKLISTAIMQSGSKAKDSSYGGKLWFVLFAISRPGAGKPGYDEEDYDNSKRGAAAPRSSVVWNSLLRMLGMDGVEDNGVGILHKNEPYQGVILDPRTLGKVTTFDNPKTDDSFMNEYKNLASMKVNDGYIGDVVQYVRDTELAYNPKFRKYCDKIVNNVLELLRKTPGIYKRLSMDDIKFILQLNKKHEVIKELVTGLYKAKFPKIKEEMDQMIDDWQYNISSEHWQTLAPDRKERQRVMIAPPYLLDRAKKIIRDLTPFKSDMHAAQIIDYLETALEVLSTGL